jgi:hypothetical protein
MKHASFVFASPLIGAHLTDEQIRDYIKQGPTWLTVEEVKASEHLRREAFALAYAGENPMSHHGAPVNLGGMAGAAQFMSRLATPESYKFKAGQWLVAARRHRARGDLPLAKASLLQAMRFRAKAAGKA